MSLALLIAVGVVLAAAAATVLYRRHARAAPATLTPGAQGGEDLAYPYYVDDAELRQLGTSLNVEIPTSVQRQTGAGLRATLPGGSEGTVSAETTREVGGEINLAALTRHLREFVTADRLAAEVALVPRAGDGGRSAHGIHAEALATEKRTEFQAVAAGNRLVLLRGHLEHVARLPGARAEVGPTLRLSHLSSEELEPGRSVGQGDPAAVRMPEGLEVRVELAIDECCTASGRERFEAGMPFFGEVIAHSPTFDSDTGVLTCIAAAVWGCPAPTTGDEGIAY